MRIEEIRGRRGLSQAELASLIDLKEEDILKIERGGECSVSTMLKIASALECDLHELIYGKQFGQKSVQITRSNERVPVKRRSFLDYESLSGYLGRHMEPFLVKVYPEVDSREFSIHSGEEFHYVVSGTLHLTVGDEDHTLNEGDSAYFDSSLPHALSGVGGPCRVMAVIYNTMEMKHRVRSPKMRQLIEAARHPGGRDVVLAVPNETSLEALERAMEEEIVGTAYLVGDQSCYPQIPGRFSERFMPIHLALEDGEASGCEAWQARCAARAVDLLVQGKGHMLMKGQINTAILFKAVLNKQKGLVTGRRLSLVSIFELARMDRLLFLTDPGINTELAAGHDLDAARDIILNGIDVARALGVHRPKVALLDANERPSDKIPSSVLARDLAAQNWDGAIVEGPLSYDLALYPESAEHKGITDSPVAGRADVLVVPQISGGNFLYKAWGMTMGAEYANIVAGARIPLIITSRSDSDMTKFLTLCASAVYSLRE